MGKKTFTPTSNSNLELNCHDKLIRDEVTALNKRTNHEPSYAFTEHQAKEIARRCRYKCNISFQDGIYIIEKDERWFYFERI